MDTTFVALLRGVNVGSSGRVKMAELSTALGDAGVSVATTVLQSGNVVVTSWSQSAAVLQDTVSAVLWERFAITSPCVAWPARRWRQLVARAPLGDRRTDDARLNVHFVDPPLTAAQWRTVAPATLSTEDVTVILGTLVQWCPEGYSNSVQVAPLLERKLAVRVTVRNWRTILRVADALE